jgi:hypothetical protein
VLGDVDGLVRDQVAPVLQDGHGRPPRSSLVADLGQADPDVAVTDDPGRAEPDLARVLLAPLAEGLQALEALARLGELQHGVGVVDLVLGVDVDADGLEVATNLVGTAGGARDGAAGGHGNLLRYPVVQVT